MAESKTVAGAYQKIEAHEDICAVRYSAIHDTLAELKEGQKSHSKAAWGLVLALLGWAGVQLWNGQVVHQAPAPAVVTVTK